VREIALGARAFYRTFRQVREIAETHDPQLMTTLNYL